MRLSYARVTLCRELFGAQPRYYVEISVRNLQEKRSYVGVQKNTSEFKTWYLPQPTSRSNGAYTGSTSSSDSQSFHNQLRCTSE